jgi:hypothetical protein
MSQTQETQHTQQAIDTFFPKLLSSFDTILQLVTLLTVIIGLYKNNIRRVTKLYRRVTLSDLEVKSELTILTQQLRQRLNADRIVIGDFHDKNRMSITFEAVSDPTRSIKRRFQNIPLAWIGAELQGVSCSSFILVTADQTIDLRCRGHLNDIGVSTLYSRLIGTPDFLDGIFQVQFFSERYLTPAEMETLDESFSVIVQLFKKVSFR